MCLFVNTLHNQNNSYVQIIAYRGEQDQPIYLDQIRKQPPLPYRYIDSIYRVKSPDTYLEHVKDAG